MKREFALLLSVLAIPMIVSCKGTASSSSNNSVDSTTDSSTDSSSDNSTGGTISVVPPASLEECLERTENYILYFGTPEAKTFMEVNTENMYYYGPQAYGYSVLDEDPYYMHYFSIGSKAGGGLEMEMNGRVGSSGDFVMLQASANSFYKLIYDTKDYYERIDDWTYEYTGNQLLSEYKPFFQLNAFNFCNRYTLKIAQNGRIESFIASEYYDGYDEAIESVKATVGNPADTSIDFFDQWRQNGSKIKERIFDYKSFYSSVRSVEPCYDYGDIDAIVTSLDYDGSFFIANNDERSGAIGMRVTPKNEVSVEIGDKVNVKGDIRLDLSGKYYMSARFVNASVKVLDKGFSIPMFSEESIVDTYAPGIYAAGMFTNTPVYSASLYSGYAYAGNIPLTANESGDTIVDLFYPAFIYSATNKMFQCELRFPKECGKENTEMMLAKLKALGDYSKDTNAKLLYIQNVTVFYDVSRKIQLYFQPSSLLSHRLSFGETIAQDFGIDNFPVPTGKLSSSGFFHFGNSSQFYLEDQYYIEKGEDPLSGVMFFANNTDRAMVNTFINGLKAIGGTLYDIIMINYSSDIIHHIYTLENNVVVDIMFDDANGVTSRAQIFVYQSEKICRTKTIGENLEEVCDFFKDEDFIRLPNTYDSNYRLYELTSFAGNSFSKDNPLLVATMDLLEDRYDELRQAYRDAGWKIYRNEDNKAYSYSSRGNTRVVYYKDSDNGKKIFLDFGSYPTSDYTFTGHRKFNYRVEIAIYEAEAPFKTQYTQNLDSLIEDAVITVNTGVFKWTLKEGYKAEVFMGDKSGVSDVSFGYNYSSNAFIYPDVNDEAHLEELLNYVLETFESNGYKLIARTSRGYNYGYPKEDKVNQYHTYLYCMKDSSRGFVRVIAGIGGVDF